MGGGMGGGRWTGEPRGENGSMSYLRSNKGLNGYVGNDDSTGPWRSEVLRRQEMQGNTGFDKVSQEGRADHISFLSRL